MSDTFFTRSGSSPGTSLEALADLVLRSHDVRLVAVLDISPVMALFRSASSPDASLCILPAVDLHKRTIAEKLGLD